MDGAAWCRWSPQPESAVCCDGVCLWWSQLEKGILPSFPSLTWFWWEGSFSLSLWIPPEQRNCQQGACRLASTARPLGGAAPSPVPPARTHSAVSSRRSQCPAWRALPAPQVCACAPCLQQKQLLARESSLLTPNVFLRAWLRQDLSSLCPGGAPAVLGAPAWCVLVSRVSQAPLGSLSCTGPRVCTRPSHSHPLPWS